MTAATTLSPRLDQIVRERLEDIADVLVGEGHGRRSRAELTRALIFACPVDDPDHLKLVIRYGTMRLFNEVDFPNDGWIAEAEADLGWYRESVGRSEIVAELARVRRELSHMKWHLDESRKTLAELIGDGEDG